MNFLLSVLLSLSLGNPHAEKVNQPDVKPVLKNEKSVQLNLNYPEVAKELGINGKVRMKLEIDTRGKVSDAQVVFSPSPILTSTVKQHVKSLKFSPAQHQGKTVKTDILMDFSFQN